MSPSIESSFAPNAGYPSALFIICAYPHHTQPAEPDVAKSVHAPSVPHMPDSKTVLSSASPKIQEQVAGPCRNIGT